MITTKKQAPTEPSGRNGTSKIVATYDYRDERGVLLFQTLRYDPKDFRQRRPDGNGGWIYDLKGVRRVLYRLPELLASTGTVLIPEGEKDVDRLISLDFTATTSPMGANAPWSPEYSETLRGRDVALFSDNDDPGRKRVQKVYDALRGIANSVVIVHLPGLPEHGDVSDYLNSGKSKWNLASEIDAARKSQNSPPERSDADESLPKDDPPQSAGWAELKPLPHRLPAVKSFDSEMLPAVVRPFVDDIADRMQCPPDFPAVAMMIAVAGVVGNRVRIRPKRRDNWTVTPNLWGGVVGRPGVMKTPAIMEPMKFPSRLEIEKRKDHQVNLDQHQIALTAYESIKKQRKKAIEDAIKAGTDHLEAAKAMPTMDEPKEPTIPRIIINDSTVPKLGELLNQNPNGLLVYRDELVGLLRDLDREGHESDRAFFLEAWDGSGSFTHDRVARGTTHIPHLTLSILGGITPGVLDSYLREAFAGGKGDDGLVQRFQLAVYPDISGERRNVDRWPDTAAKNAAWDMFKRLDKLNMKTIEATQDDGEGPYFLQFDPEAQMQFNEWFTNLNLAIRKFEDHAVIEGHRSKYRSLVPSLALLIHLADGGIGAIPTEPLRKAIAWVTYLESHARRIYSIVTGCTSAVHELASRISKKELPAIFTMRELYRRHWAGLKDKADVEPAVDQLLQLSWLREVATNTKGRPTTTYEANPRIFTSKDG